MTPNGSVMTPAASDVMAETRVNAGGQLLPGGHRAAQAGVRRRTDAAQVSGLFVLFIGLVDAGSSAPAGSRHRRSGLSWAATSSARVIPATISCWPARAATGRHPPQRAAEVAMALSSSSAVPPALRVCPAYGSPPSVPRESPCRPS